MIEDATLDRRFWSKVDTRTEGECWEWHGALNSSGYGAILAWGRVQLAHRVALQLHLGRELGEGMLACHHCDNPPCVNARHLFEGARKDNSRDMAKKGRAGWQGKTGPAHPSSRLSEEQREDVRRRWVAGESGGKIAWDYGVTPQTIYSVVKGIPGGSRYPRQRAEADS